MIDVSVLAAQGIDIRLWLDVFHAEGCKLVAYLDTLGNWTIGVGHLLPKPAPGKSWEGFTITQDVADRYFLGDLVNALKRHAQALPEWPKLDTACRQNAVVELCFNMGGRWGTFVNTRAAIERQDWQSVHDGLLDSAWASQVGPTRSTRLANYLLKGEYDQVGDGT